MKQFRPWVGITLAVIVVLLVALITLDLLGIRQFIPLSDHYDWLAFLGALVGGTLGGLFTFGGVYLTLRQQRESDRLQLDAEELKNRLSIMPLFEYAISYDKADFDNSAGQLANEPPMPIYKLDGGEPGDPDSFEFLYDIVIRNVGLGHALLTKVTLRFLDNSNQLIETQSYGFVNFLVKKDSRRDLRHFIYAPRNTPRFPNPRQYAYAIEVLVEYKDLLGDMYQQKVLTGIAKSLYAEEGPSTGGIPFASFSHADPPTRPA